MMEQNGLGRSSATEASRTGLDPATLARSLRRMAGDGSMEWVMEPMQVRVLLDVADALDERARLISVLHEVEAEAVDAYICLQHDCELLTTELEDRFRKYWHEQCENAKLRELVQELWVSCPVHDSDCDECKHKGGRTGCELYDRMRELGVEVSQ